MGSSVIHAAMAPVRAIGRGVQAVGLAGYSAGAIVFGRSSSFGWWFLPRTKINYQREVGDPSTNSIVTSVVGWIGRNFPEAPLTATRVRLAADGSLDTLTPIMPGPYGPGRLLQLMERPNPEYSGALQMRATVLDYYVSGDGYWLKQRDDRDQVTALWWIPQWMMEPKGDPSDTSVLIAYYEYRVNGQVYRFRRRDVFHIRYGIDPENPRKGRSPLKSVLREIYTDSEASAFSAALVRNMGVPGVVISPANTTATSPMRSDPEGVKTSFQESFGGDNRGAPMVMKAPTEIKVLSFNPEQMQFRDLRKIPEERISGALGVAAVVAGLGAGLDRSTFANYGEARAAAYTESVIPEQRVWAAELEVQMLPDFPDVDGDPLGRSYVDLAFDWRVVSAMQEAAADIWKRFAEAATKGLLTRRAFLKAVGLPESDADEVFVVPNNYVVMTVDQASDTPKLTPPPGAPQGGPPSFTPAGQLGAGAPPADDPATIPAEVTT